MPAGGRGDGAGHVDDRRQPALRPRRPATGGGQRLRGRPPQRRRAQLGAAPLASAGLPVDPGRLPQAGRRRLRRGAGRGRGDDGGQHAARRAARPPRHARGPPPPPRRRVDRPVGRARGLRGGGVRAAPGRPGVARPRHVRGPVHHRDARRPGDAGGRARAGAARVVLHGRGVGRGGVPAQVRRVVVDRAGRGVDRPAGRAPAGAAAVADGGGVVGGLRRGGVGAAAGVERPQPPDRPAGPGAGVGVAARGVLDPGVADVVRRAGRVARRPVPPAVVAPERLAVAGAGPRSGRAGRVAGRGGGGTTPTRPPSPPSPAGGRASRASSRSRPWRTCRCWSPATPSSTPRSWATAASS